MGKKVQNSKSFCAEVINSFKGTDQFRKLVSDRYTHEFYITRDSLFKESALAFGVEDLKEFSKSDIGKKCRKFTGQFFLSLESTFPENNQPGRYEVEHIKVTNKIFHIRVTGPTQHSDVYRWIFRKLAPLKNTLYNNLKTHIFTESTLKKRNFIDLSHEGGTQIGRNASKGILDHFDAYFKARPNIRRTEVERFLFSVEADIGRIQTDKKVAFITYRNAARNRGIDRVQDNKAFEKSLKIIQDKIAEHLDGLTYQEISREAYAALAKGIANSSKVKLGPVKFYDLSKTKEDLKLERKNYTAFQDMTPTQKARVSQANAISLPAIMQMINASLPAQVEQNMHSPALNWRTGRFSSSVRMLTLTSSKRGVAEGSYTYQIRPYQTFEPGYAKGSMERDPRRLIEKSIREIAKDYIKVNKFNLTRRGR